MGAKHDLLLEQIVTDYSRAWVHEHPARFQSYNGGAIIPEEKEALAAARTALTLFFLKGYKIGGLPDHDLRLAILEADGARRLGSPEAMSDSEWKAFRLAIDAALSEGMPAGAPPEAPGSAGLPLGLAAVALVLTSPIWWPRVRALR